MVIMSPVKAAFCIKCLLTNKKKVEIGQEKVLEQIPTFKGTGRKLMAGYRKRAKGKGIINFTEK